MKTSILAVILIGLMSCMSQKNELNKSSATEYKGLIQSQGISSYQYGTHTLTTEESFYALTSETVDLTDYVGKTITLTAEPIQGYPVDGGPLYLNVISIKP